MPVTAAPTLPPPQPGIPFPAPSPNPTLPRRLLVSCPTCGVPLPGLLAGCDKPLCLTAELDYDALFVRADDI